MKMQERAAWAARALVAMAGVTLCGVATGQADKIDIRCLRVTAAGEWQGSAIVAQAGRFMCVAADGLWTHGGQGVQQIIPWYGPRGWAQDPMVKSRVGALLARIGDNTPFAVEEQLCFVPRTSGELRLAMYDDPGTYGNNEGALQVLVATWSTPALPASVHLNAARDCPAARATLNDR